MNRKDCTIHVDFTGKFPIQSMDGMVEIFMVNNWNMNAIIATPVKSTKEEKIVECFKQNIEYLSNIIFKLVLNIINNVVSRLVQAYLEKDNVDMQLVKPHNHRVNTEERAIQTF